MKEEILIRKICDHSQFKLVNWNQDRFLTAVVQKDNERYFLKIAQDNELRINLENEIEWNLQFNRLVENQQKDFHSPTIVKEGDFKDFRYALLEYFPPEKCFWRKGRVVKKFEDYLNQIVNLLFWLQKIEIELPSDESSKFPDYRQETEKRVFERAQTYAEDTKEDFDGLLEIIKSTKLKTSGVSHREIKPSHLFDLDGDLGIIDAEWATHKIPTYYDIAACYARTFAKRRAPDYADQLLTIYCRRIKEVNIDLREFAQQFRALLAWRTIGEYRDAYKVGKVEKEYGELRKRILDNNFPY